MADATFIDVISPKASQQILELKNNVVLTVKEMKELVTVAKGIKLPSELNNFSGKASESIKKTNKALTESEKLTKKLAQSKQKLINAQTKEGKEIIKNNVATTQANRLSRQAAREQLGLVGAYTKLNQKRTQAQKRLQNLLSAEKKNTKEIERARRAYTRLNARVQKVDRATNNFSKNIGNYRSALGGLRGTIMGLVSALGLMGGAFLFVSTIRNAIGVIRDYEKQNATLASVLQKTTEETAELRAESQRLGATTVKTATEVTALQIEYARLGFSQEQIIALTEATIQGSIAMNAELAETAKLTGAVVNSMDEFSATDAPEIMDIMSLATAKSALDFSKLNTQLPIVLGAANALKVPFTEVVSTLGKLSDAGIEASTAATSLRNIYIEAAKKGIDYKKALQQITNSTDKLKTANELFGKRAAVSALVVANNTEAVEELDVALQGAAGTSQEMAEKELNTLDGALKLLESAWQGVILGTGDANDISGKLAKTVRFVADNLEDAVSVVGALIKTFLIYKGVLITINIVKRAAAAYTVAYRIALIAMNKGVISAIRSLKFLRVALINTGIGAAVIAVGALVYAFTKLNKSVIETAAEMHEANEEFISGAESTIHLNKALGKAADRYDELTKELSINKGETEENKKKQEELDGIIKLIAKHVPEAVTEVDKYGKALAINTDKVRDFNTENGKLLQKEAELNIQNQTKALKTLKEQQEQFNKVFESGNATYVKGFGVIRQVGAELFKLETIIGKTGNARVVETKLTLEQEVAYRKAQKANIDSINIAQKDVESNEDVISSITGVLNERQKLAKQAEDDKKAKAKAVAEEEAKIVTIKKLQDAIKKLREEKELTDVTDKKRHAEIDREIKANQDIIDSLTKKGKAKKKEAELTEGSVKWYQAEISKLKELRDSKKLTREEYVKETEAISKLQKELDALIGKQEKKIKKDKQLVKSGTVDYYNQQISALEKERSSVANTASEYKLYTQLIENLIKAKESLTGANNDEANSTEEAKRKILEYENAVESFLNTFSQDIVSGSGFETTFDILSGKIEGFGTDWAVTTNAIMESTQEMFNFIDQFSQASFEKRVSNLQQEKDIALLLAGDSAEAKERIEKQYEERVSRLEAKRAKQKKNLALFNIGIDTAQGIVSTIGNVGFPAAIPLIALIAAIGVAQAALVSSAEIPQFKDGHLTGTHSGLALVNDGGRDEFLERRGQVHRITGRNVLLDMQKGDKIHKSEQSMHSHFNTELNNELLKNGIYAQSTPINPQIKVVNQGITKGEMQNVLRSELGRNSSSINFDKRGFSQYSANSLAKSKSLNNKVRFKGGSV